MGFSTVETASFGGSLTTMPTVHDALKYIAPIKKAIEKTARWCLRLSVFPSEAVHLACEEHQPVLVPIQHPHYWNGRISASGRCASTVDKRGIARAEKTKTHTSLLHSLPSSKCAVNVTTGLLEFPQLLKRSVHEKRHIEHDSVTMQIVDCSWSETAATAGK